MEGGVLAFVAKYLGGSQVIGCLMAGPSAITHHFHKVAVHLPSGRNGDTEYLLQEPLTIGEQQGLYGYVEQCDSSIWMLIPTEAIFTKYFSLFLKGWTIKCSKFMTEILEKIKWMITEAQMETGWKDFILQYLADNDLSNTYHVTQDDTDYGQSLINSRYPVSWKKIKLTEMQIPKVYDTLFDEVQ